MAEVGAEQVLRKDELAVAIRPTPHREDQHVRALRYLRRHLCRHALQLDPDAARRLVRLHLLLYFVEQGEFGRIGEQRPLGGEIVEQGRHDAIEGLVLAAGVLPAAAAAGRALSESPGDIATSIVIGTDGSVNPHVACTRVAPLPPGKG